LSNRCQTVIEVDGSSHNVKGNYDEKREAFLKELGLKIIYVVASDVLQKLDSVMIMLEHHPYLQNGV
jgi:very-short-patch-repair endonuclease